MGQIVIYKQKRNKYIILILIIFLVALSIFGTIFVSYNNTGRYFEINTFKISKLGSEINYTNEFLHDDLKRFKIKSTKNFDNISIKLIDNNEQIFQSINGVNLLENQELTFDILRNLTKGDYYIYIFKDLEIDFQINKITDIKVLKSKAIGSYKFQVN